MQIVMARASGRKRKFRGHVPGRLNVRPLSAGELAAEQPHRRVLPPALRLAPEAETPFGCLRLWGTISEDQYLAGERYRVVVHEYSSSIGVPAGDHFGGRGYPCKGDPRCGISEPGEPDTTCECRRRKVAYNSAFEALAPAGHQSQVAVSHIAVHGRGVGDRLEHLLRGLRLLVEHFEIGRRR
jgi:hypothetical protein